MQQFVVGGKEGRGEEGGKGRCVYVCVGEGGVRE